MIGGGSRKSKILSFFFLFVLLISFCFISFAVAKERSFQNLGISSFWKEAEVFFIGSFKVRIVEGKTSKIFFLNRNAFLCVVDDGFFNRNKNNCSIKVNFGKLAKKKKKLSGRIHILYDEKGYIKEIILWEIPR
jgi:hypothetical protein